MYSFFCILGGGFWGGWGGGGVMNMDMPTKKRTFLSVLEKTKIQVCGYSTPEQKGEIGSRIEKYDYERFYTSI